MRDLRDRIVAVTGASSGIGRATVQRLVDAGVTVVAIARGREALDGLAAELTGRTGHVEVAALDVTDGPAVERLVADLLDRHGGLDAWVNIAGVTTYGRFEDLPAAEFDRVVEVNLLGSANGARAVLPHFREHGAGTLINVSSVLGRFGTPLMSPYVASKFAVRGWSESLRLELRDAPGVAVCTVLPSSVDTPLFRHAGNHTGQQVQSPMLPMDPHRVATAIVDALRHPRREIVVGQTPRLIMLARAVLPGPTERVLGPAMAADHTGGSDVPATSGALFASPDDGEVTGGWRAVPVPSALRIVRGAGALVGAVASAGVAAAGDRLRR